MMQANAPGSTNTLPTTSTQQNMGANNKAVRTHTYPKLPDKFKVRNDQPPPDEEVIYF